MASENRILNENLIIKNCFPLKHYSKPQNITVLSSNEFEKISHLIFNPLFEFLRGMFDDKKQSRSKSHDFVSKNPQILLKSLQTLLKMVGIVSERTKKRVCGPFLSVVVLIISSKDILMEKECKQMICMILMRLIEQYPFDVNVTTNEFFILLRWVEKIKFDIDDFCNNCAAFLEGRLKGIIYGTSYVLD